MSQLQRRQAGPQAGGAPPLQPRHADRCAARPRVGAAVEKQGGQEQARRRGFHQPGACGAACQDAPNASAGAQSRRHTPRCPAYRHNLFIQVQHTSGAVLRPHAQGAGAHTLTGHSASLARPAALLSRSCRGHSAHALLQALRHAGPAAAACRGALGSGWRRGRCSALSRRRASSGSRRLGVGLAGVEAAVFEFVGAAGVEGRAQRVGPCSGRGCKGGRSGGCCVPHTASQRALPSLTTARPPASSPPPAGAGSRPARCPASRRLQGAKVSGCFHWHECVKDR